MVEIEIGKNLALLLIGSVAIISIVVVLWLFVRKWNREEL